MTYPNPSRPARGFRPFRSPLLALCILALCTSAAPATAAPIETLPPPTDGTGLAARLGADEAAAWRDGDVLTFLYRSNDTGVGFSGPVDHAMDHVAGTDLWILRLQHPGWSRAFFSYRFRPAALSTRLLVPSTTYQWRGENAQPPATEAQTLSGQILHRTIDSRSLGERRDLTVYLPPSGQANAAASCSFDRENMLALDQNAFDQDMHGGWRMISDRDGCDLAAADLIRDYRARHRLDPWILLWHEGQLRATANQSAAAIALFERARQEQGELTGWNPYVDATIAFLRNDRPALLAARAALAATPWPAELARPNPQGPPVNIAWPPNLNIVDGLIACFGQPYSEAYSACRGNRVRTRRPRAPAPSIRRANLPAIFLADGDEVEDFAKVIEPLILSGRIRPIALIGVHNGGYRGDRSAPFDITKDFRAREYLERLGQELPVLADDRFARHMSFFTQEVPAWATRELGISSARRDRAVFGYSNGGAFAASAAISHPEVFGYALPFSVAMAPLGGRPRSPLPQFFFTAGEFEPPFDRTTQGLHQQILAWGGHSSFAAYMSGHESYMWKLALVDAVQRIFPPRVAAPR